VNFAVPNRPNLTFKSLNLTGKIKRLWGTFLFNLGELRVAVNECLGGGLFRKLALEEE